MDTTIKLLRIAATSKWKHSPLLTVEKANESFDSPQTIVVGLIGESNEENYRLEDETGAIALCGDLMKSEHMKLVGNGSAIAVQGIVAHLDSKLMLEAYDCMIWNEQKQLTECLSNGWRSEGQKDFSTVVLLNGTNTLANSHEAISQLLLDFLTGRTPENSDDVQQLINHVTRMIIIGESAEAVIESIRSSTEMKQILLPQSTTSPLPYQQLEILLEAMRANAPVDIISMKDNLVHIPMHETSLQSDNNLSQLPMTTPLGSLQVDPNQSYEVITYEHDVSHHPSSSTRGGGGGIGYDDEDERRSMDSSHSIEFSDYKVDFTNSMKKSHELPELSENYHELSECWQNIRNAGPKVINNQLINLLCFIVYEARYRDEMRLDNCEFCCSLAELFHDEYQRLPQTMEWKNGLFCYFPNRDWPPCFQTYIDTFQNKAPSGTFLRDHRKRLNDVNSEKCQQFYLGSQILEIAMEVIGNICTLLNPIWIELQNDEMIVSKGTSYILRELRNRLKPYEAERRSNTNIYQAIKRARESNRTRGVSRVIDENEINRMKLKSIRRMREENWYPNEYLVFYMLGLPQGSRCARIINTSNNKPKRKYEKSTPPRIANLVPNKGYGGESRKKRGKGGRGQNSSSMGELDDTIPLKNEDEWNTNPTMKKLSSPGMGSEMIKPSTTTSMTTTKSTIENAIESGEKYLADCLHDEEVSEEELRETKRMLRNLRAQKFANELVTLKSLGSNEVNVPESLLKHVTMGSMDEMMMTTSHPQDD